jgi:hypothetical protein
MQRKDHNPIESKETTMQDFAAYSAGFAQGQADKRNQMSSMTPLQYEDNADYAADMQRVRRPASSRPIPRRQLIFRRPPAEAD